MLDRLPPEILDDILLLAASPPHHHDGYQSKERTLSSCCQVSRALCARAQPLLWRDVVLLGPQEDGSREFRQFAKLLWLDFGKKDEDLKERLEQSVPRLMALVRTFRIEEYDLSSTARVAMLLAVLASLPPTVQQVQLDIGYSRGSCKPLSLLRLAPVATSLRTLTCCFTAFAGNSIVLSSLTILSLTEVTASLSTFSALFSSCTLPALRVLAFKAMFSRGETRDNSFEALTPTFLSQLDLFHLTTDDLTHLPNAVCAGPFALVVSWAYPRELDRALRILQRLNLSNLQLHLPHIFCIDLDSHSLGTLSDARHVFASLPSLRAFHLPPFADRRNLLPSVRSGLTALVQTCETRGVEVCYGVELGEVWNAVKRMRAKADEEKGREG
ncbi:hypothetical protein JCM6882_000624 [Rhodosporidiobolus microsporus]